MSRKLEKFIGDHRNEFDDAVPNEKVWQHVELAITNKKQNQKGILAALKNWKVAAAIVLVAGISIVMVLRYNQATTTHPLASKENPLLDTAALKNEAIENTPEVIAVARLVVMKQEELKTLAAAQPELYRQFTNDMNQLDSSYTSLKNQLSTSPNREVLMQAMIQNLQLQLNVLNQQLNIINQIKKTKNDSHEKSDQFM